MSLNMKTLTDAFTKTAILIEKTVQTKVQDITAPKPLTDYDLITQIGSGGPSLCWKLFSAKPKSPSSHQYPFVTVWVLDKKAVSEARVKAGLSKGLEDAFLEIVRGDVGRMVRLRHPGVVHVVQGLDESKGIMAMVTEPLFASVANALGSCENIGTVTKELKEVEMKLLEVKHGLLQVAETLDFLHNNARLIHRAISPESVFITSSGAWKLGGFGFAISADQSSGAQSFHYSEYDVEDSILPLQPSLNYTAPELVRGNASTVGVASDIFSFGCLAYHLITRKPLFDCHNNTKMYMNNLTYLAHGMFSNIPPELVPDLQRMLSVNEATRPSALDFTGSPFFRDDTRLRALRFLDHLLEKDNMQKTEFLKALSDMWKDFDSRVLRYKVLPPLCAELRNMVMQPMILPMVLTIAESQEKNDFELSTLPALVPVLSTAAGETLLLLVKHAELIINKSNQEHLITHILPLLVRAYDDNDVRIQEEVLRRTVSLAKQLDAQLVKQAILPRVHGLALKTTIAAVRVNALLCLGDLVSTLDKHAVLDILQTIQRCTDVDRSPPTLMCTLGVANLILKQYGVEFAAEHVLPLLMPLLITQQLNVQQFAKYMLFVKDILRKIEEKRGVTLTESGTPFVKRTPITNGVQSEQLLNTSRNVSSLAKTSPAWDEDWGPISKGPATSFQPSGTNVPSIQPVVPAPETVSSPSCPPVDIEWPPRSSSVATQINDLNPMQSSGGVSTPSLDDIDPFANWPPRSTSNTSMSTTPQNSINFSTNSNSSGFSYQNKGNSTMSTNYHNGGGFMTQNSSGLSGQSQGSLASNINSLNSGKSVNSQRPVDFSHHNYGNSTLNSSIFSSSYTEPKPKDIGSIFTLSKNEQPGLRLAPPPQTSVGRGRGNRVNQGQPSRSSSKIKPSPSVQQPPLLDLL